MGCVKCFDTSNHFILIPTSNHVQSCAMPCQKLFANIQGAFYGNFKIFLFHQLVAALLCSSHSPILGHPTYIILHLPVLNSIHQSLYQSATLTKSFWRIRASPMILTALCTALYNLVSSANFKIGEFIYFHHLCI